MRFFAAALIFFGAAASHAQAPEVPHKMHFAGMTLTIRDDARREIQADVNALTRSAKYFNIKLERAKTYFPFIEKIFAEERLPDDFKYLSLQESALIPDAVSVSDAVGFWQFKKETAEEMGMRVDKEIDERMNIISASRGAARYLKKSNYLFNNWIYALQSYQMGAGGVQRSVGDDHNGAKHMDITSDTYWYVKKFLAHKVAYENALKGEAQLKIVNYQPENATTVKAIAQLLSIEEAKLLEYNKWIRKGTIPDDRKYDVFIPSGTATEDFSKLYLSSKSSTAVSAVSQPVANGETVEKTIINAVPAIKAKSGESVATLASRAKVDLSEFLRFNDISIDHRVKPGSYYFVDRKKAKAKENVHILKAGENMWMISQVYGVQLKKLMKYNRLSASTSVLAGTQLWLNARKPKDNSLPVDPSKVLGVSEKDTFDWYSNPVASSNRKNTSEVKDVVSAPIDPSVDTSDKKEEQIISVPTSAQGALVEFHEVKTSDTLYSVARQYGVTIKELMDWNGKTELSLSVGERLRVAPR
jgi:membrane-bound lytic murein transglycosylase D